MAKYPNLIFVFPDEYRKQAMGFMNEDPVLTPHIDRFASEGLVLTDAVSNRPVCSPYRAMLFSGQYPHANGVLGNVNSTTVQYENYLQET
ncbi:MAG: sulfatase-like hydrolase/transferase, partial [Candidatus Latescibacteria bacterium]|nr:sulfatase-like hydrolase/transferase [Candidatus Latescibacterota bacterium]